MTCPICGNEHRNRTHQTKEMFLGTRDPFTYAECDNCGVLWLLDPPDLSRYYEPRDYVPLGAAETATTGRLERAIRSRLTGAMLHGLPLDRLRPPGHWTRLLRHASQSSSILDIGAGNGSFLQQLHRHGFQSLTGIDPYLTQKADGIQLERTTLDDFQPHHQYDFIFLNDVLEHVPDPSRTLEQTIGLLNPGGTIVVRTPLADSFAWRTYGSNWFALDPPRHLVIQTRASMELLGSKAELTVKCTVYDSNYLQFYGSELYQRGIALNESPKPAPDRIRKWNRHAARLNKLADGDHATFVLEQQPVRVVRQPNPAPS